MNQIENIDYEYSNALNIASFNPLDRGNLNQIRHGISLTEMNELVKGFNPLDRGNLNQIWCWEYVLVVLLKSFNPLDRGI